MQPDEEHPLKNMTHDVLHDLVHFDARLFRTLPVLLFKPGKLTQHAFSGAKDLYVKPLALFVFLNFVFFLVKSRGLFGYTLKGYRFNFPEQIHTALIESHLSLPLLNERFNTAMHFEQKEYLIIMVPLFALLLQLLFLAKRRHFVQHLVFSLHFYAFFIVFLIVAQYLFDLVRWLAGLFKLSTGFMDTEQFLTILLLAAPFFYLLFAVKRVYEQKWLMTIVTSAILSCGVALLISFVFRNFLFFAVMHTVTEI